MSRVITFSTVFQKSHPRAGEPTYFVEQILNWYCLQDENPYFSVTEMIFDLNGDKVIYQQAENITQKFNRVIRDKKGHTIRSGQRWKVGDKFSPRVWYGKPYSSKQITIAPDIEIKKIWALDIDKKGLIYIDGSWIEDISIEHNIARNDGLSHEDFLKWLVAPCYLRSKPFSGQIICWNENIEY